MHSRAPLIRTATIEYTHVSALSLLRHRCDLMLYFVGTSRLALKSLGIQMAIHRPRRNA